jgi:hypothetical protein
LRSRLPPWFFPYAGSSRTPHDPQSTLIGCRLCDTAWGDASIESAAAAGGIGKVEHVDYHLEVFFFVYRRFTTEVYGD